MSLADDMIEHIMDMDEYYVCMQIDEEAKAGFWETKDGTQIHVTDMTTSHIKNAINFIKKRNYHDRYLPWINRFKEELERRGEKLKD